MIRSNFIARQVAGFQRQVSSVAKVKATYFGVFARGPPVALALELSGVDWEGAFPEKWADLKPITPFLELPVLEVPEIGMIGQEVAILNYIGSLSPEMGGATRAEFLVSQQLIGTAEDIYVKLTGFKRGYVDEETAKAFWVNKDTTSHNKDFGVYAYLTALEEFVKKCGVGEGKFTASGKSVGEVKLWCMLHCCVMIKADCLAEFPGIKLFYDRVLALKETQGLLKTGLRFGKPFEQYFTG